MGRTGKAPEEEKPDIGKGGQADTSSTRSHRERAPKKIFSPTDPPVAASKVIASQKTRTESSPVSSKSSCTSKMPNASKTSRSSSISFSGELEPNADAQSTSAANVSQTAEVKPEVHESVKDRPVKEVVDSDNDSVVVFAPSLAERVKRNRESTITKPIATPTAPSKKKVTTQPSKSEKKSQPPQQQKSKAGGRKTSPISMSSEKAKKLPTQPNRLPETGVSQKSGKKEIVGKVVEKNIDTNMNKSKTAATVLTSKVLRSSSLEEKSAKPTKSVKAQESKEPSNVTVQAKISKTGTNANQNQATPVSNKLGGSEKMKDIENTVTGVSKVQQGAGPSNANEMPNRSPPIRTILPQLTEEGKRLRAETQRIQAAGVTEMEDRPPILPKVTEEFTKRLYDPYVRARMREECSGSEQSSADVETPPPHPRNMNEETESAEEFSDIPPIAMIPSLEKDVGEEESDTSKQEKIEQAEDKEELPTSFEKEPPKANSSVPEANRILRNKTKTTAGPSNPVKDVGTTKSVMSPTTKTSASVSTSEIREEVIASSNVPQDVQLEKIELAEKKIAPALDIPIVPRVTRRTAKQKETSVSSSSEGHRDTASTSSETEKLAEKSEESVQDTSCDKKKKKNKKKKRSEKHQSEDPSHEDEVQDSSAPETPKGSLKFKISLKGSPTIKASTPCNDANDEEGEQVDEETEVTRGKKQPKAVALKKRSQLESASKPTEKEPKAEPFKDGAKEESSTSGTPILECSNIFASIFEKTIKEESMDYEYTGEKLISCKSDESEAVSPRIEEPKKSDDVSARTRSSRNAVKLVPAKLSERERDEGTQSSISPELGEAGLGFSYPRPDVVSKAEETGSKLGKRSKSEEEEESETISTRTLRPRKPAISAPKKQIVKKTETVLPYYTGPVRDLKPISRHEPTLTEERKNRIEAMTQAIRNALLSEPLRYEPEEHNSDDEPWGQNNPASLYYYVNDNYKWERPQLENGKEYDPDDFEEVGAELPQLRDKKLAYLDRDRDEPFWDIPENREEYYDANEEKIDRFLKQCQILGIQIDRGLRHLHSHCGHNPQQAIETIERRAKSMILYQPLNEREREIFQEIYRAYGKNFRKIAYFVNLPCKKMVQHYYKSKKIYSYKKLMLQNPVRINCRISEGKFPGTCFFCKRKARTLKADRRFEGDEHPRLICMTCRTNRRAVNGHLEKWTEIFQGDRNQELDLPIHSERLTEKERYREEREESTFDIQYPTDFNFLFHDELKPSFDDFTKVAAREQQRLKNLGLKISKTDKQFDPKEDFCMNLKEFFKDPSPQPSVEEQLPKMREKLKSTISECKTIWSELLELEDNSSEEDEQEEKMEEVAGLYRKMKKPAKVTTTEEFTEIDYQYTMQAFVRYGLDFPSAALIVKNKTPAAIEQFYKENKINFDKFLEPYHGRKAIKAYREKKKREEPKRADYYDKYEFKLTDSDPSEPSVTKL